MAILNWLLVVACAFLGLRQVFSGPSGAAPQYLAIAALPILASTVAGCLVFYLSARAFSTSAPSAIARAATANIALLIAGILIGVGAAVASGSVSALSIAAILGMPAVLNLNALLRRK